MGGFINTEWDIWDKECDDIDETIFNGIYALGENSFQSIGYNTRCDNRIQTFRDHVVSKVAGCYFPPKGRVFYTDTVDVRNDGLGDIFIISGVKDYFPYFEEHPADLSTWVFYPIKSLPNKVKMYGDGRLYKAVRWSFWRDGAPEHLGLIPESKTTNIHVMTGYLRVDECDNVFVAFDKRPLSPIAINRYVWKKMFCVTHSAYADRRYLWNIAIEYELLKGLYTWVVFGVNENRVKSLLYARDSPLTPSGKKRPIQHWVSSHRRRIQKGIDISISKHLRGIDSFEMCGYNMKILSPTKKARTEDAIRYEERLMKFPGYAFKNSPRAVDC